MSVEEQCRRLRRLVEGQSHAETIAITSGKGGVGKSNIALNLSILLGAAGRRVALVDADLSLANLDVLVDVNVRANLSHVLAGTRRLSEILVDLPAGVQLVPGASGIARLAQLSEFQRAQLMNELAELEADNDMIVIDTAAGIGPDVLSFAASAERIIVITTPEPTAVTDAYATIKVLARCEGCGRMSLLVNQVASRQEARTVYERISCVAREFLAVRVLDAGYVLADAKVGEAVRRRSPVVLEFPRSSAAQCLAALANKLGAAQSVRAAGEGFFKRVVNWFG